MEMTQANLQIRKKIEKSGLKHYQIANYLGVSKYTFSTWLQTKLSADKKKRILDAISKLKTE